MPVLPYVALGAATGLRSMAAPSRLSRHLTDSAQHRQPGLVSRWLARDGVGGLLRLCALGEMLVDKLPIVPDRIQPGPLSGRIGFGALAGIALAEIRREPRVRGAVLAGVGAAVGAYAGFHARRALTANTGLPDLIVAMGEDAAAILLARSAVRTGDPAVSEPDTDIPARRLDLCSDGECSR
jgi:uncharacterized membrane protein